MVPTAKGHNLIRRPIVFYACLVVIAIVALIMTVTTDGNVPHLIEGAVEVGAFVAALLSITGVSESANR